MVQAIVRGGSPGGRSEIRGVGFLKQVGFKPGEKERGSHRCTKWYCEDVEWRWNYKGRLGSCENFV